MLTTLKVCDNLNEGTKNVWWKGNYLQDRLKERNGCLRC